MVYYFYVVCRERGWKNPITNFKTIDRWGEFFETDFHPNIIVPQNWL